MGVCACWTLGGCTRRLSTAIKQIVNEALRVGLEVLEQRSQQACARVGRWLDQPCVHILQVTGGHWEILRGLMREAEATANLVPDAHLAALAISHGCTLYSNDRDFSRFPSLRWINPLQTD